MAMLFSLSLNAKVIIGKINYASTDREGTPFVDVIVDGNYVSTAYNGKPSPKHLLGQKGRYVKITTNKKGKGIRIEFVKKPTGKQKVKLPFIGKRQTKDGTTKVEIYKNGKMKINSHYKSGYKAHYNGKYTKYNVVPNGEEIHLHSWQISKNKVCSGYRKSWNCEKLYANKPK